MASVSILGTVDSSAKITMISQTKIQDVILRVNDHQRKVIILHGVFCKSVGTKFAKYSG